MRMRKDLHNIDEVFNSAYKQLKEDPSPDVWEKINAGLDKKDAESYKKRFIGWKRMSILLLLLLAGFILYESGILKTGSTHPNKNRAETVPAKENETANQEYTLPGKVNNDKSNFIDKKKSSRNEKNVRAVIIQKDNILKKVSGKSQDQQNGLSNKRINAIRDNDQPGVSLISGKNKKEVLRNNESLLKEKAVIPLIGKNSNGEIIAGLLKRILPSQPPVIRDSALITSMGKNTKQIRISPYKPYWTISGFVSYDQAGYKLDSDEPSAINSIKHREAHEPSFSGGILLTRQLTSRWSLQSGIIYANTAIGMKPQKTYAFQDPTGDVSYKYITSSGYAFIKPGFGPQPVVGDSLTTAEAKHTIENMAVPLIVQYKMMNKKISIIPGAGIEANFITKANLEVDIEDPFNREIVVVRKLNGAKSFYWSLVADAELRYSVNKKMSVTLRPAYRYAISPITKNNVVETFPHSFGLGAGVTIKL
jgi:hypothetical protein